MLSRFRASLAGSSEHAHPLPKGFGQIRLPRAGPHEFTNAVDEHALIVARQPAWVAPNDDQAADAMPPRIGRNEPIPDAHGSLLKESLGSRSI